jgi:Uma2 family endonuclease
MVTTHRQPGEIYYPEEDGKVSESAKHLEQMLQLIAALQSWFAQRADVFVGGNLFVYYRQGEPGKCFSPDVLVAKGVRSRPIEERGSYRVWEEGVVPQVLIELTSESTRQVDTIRKPRQYAALGVHEYFLFDPLGEFLAPRLQGYRLNEQGRYERLPGEELDSSELGLRLVVREGWLRLLNPTTNTLLATNTEKDDEIARLRTELARLRGEAPDA